jgi:imidazolonepropionase-like amidohydrolase
MLKRTAFSVLALILYPHIVVPQSNPDTKSPNVVLVKAARLLDVSAGRYIENAAVLIEGERIQEVGPLAQIQPHAPKSAKIIDLPGATLLPGLIDCHTHLMARTSAGPDGYILDLAKKS